MVVTMLRWNLLRKYNRTFQVQYKVMLRIALSNQLQLPGLTVPEEHSQWWTGCKGIKRALFTRKIWNIQSPRTWIHRLHPRGRSLISRKRVIIVTMGEKTAMKASHLKRGWSINAWNRFHAAKIKSMVMMMVMLPKEGSIMSCEKLLLSPISTQKT